jgi:hypothetical protein
MATSRPPTDVASTTAPLSYWLAPALLDWLQARGCRGVTLVDPDGDAPAQASLPQWQDAPARGWRVPLGDAAGSNVLLAFADRADLGDAELDDVAALFERLRAFPLVPDQRDAVLVDHAEVHRLIHDLRNGLNTLLINGSLLARASAHQPALQRSAQFLESAGLACADNLNRLSELTARPVARGHALFADVPGDASSPDLLG